jgi:DNA polymerase III delta subunit
MKIVVIHGDDEAAARGRYSRIISGVKNKSWEVVSIKTTDNFKLAERLTSGSLFPGEVLFSIDDIKKTPIEDLKWLSQNYSDFEGSLLFYAKGSVPAAIKKALPKETKYESFDTPKIIFAFLDSFFPGNTKRCLELLEKLYKETAGELIIFMLARHLRDVYWVLEGGAGMSLPDWRKGKLRSQAQKFTKENLRDTIIALADVDFKGKTGGGNARHLLELLIAEKLV